ncbi:hypothetical protein [Aliivibrio salmonicida]|uniref:hypothetical protein n=1 Tax=Aliivibrio salmonicida TaxID=40269 RepID=UPI003D150FA8
MSTNNINEAKESVEVSLKVNGQNIRIDQSKIMDKFFTERDLSTISNSPFFKINSVEWGYGFIEQVDGKDSVIDIPTDSTGLETVLAENTPSLSYPNNIITIRCVLPANTVPENDVYYFSALNIKDAKGNCIIVCAVLPIPVTSDRLLQFDIEIRKVEA